MTRPRVLLADDDPISRMVLEDLLIDIGYEVVCADDGIAALAAMAAPDAPRLALIDWMMPGLDGIEVCRRIKARGGPYTWTVLVTSRGDRGDVIAGLDAGADDYVTKPVDPPELRSRLAVGMRVLAYEQTLSERTEALARANLELERLAHTDGLTGLSNRRSFVGRLGRALTEPGDWTVLLVDVDHFKRVNDRFGHLAGDEVLRGFAAAIAASLPDGAFAGRYGGEEFVIAVPTGDAARGMAAAEAIRIAVSTTRVPVGGVDVQVTASVGVARATGRSVEAVLSDADTALYQAKSRGRNRSCVTAPA
ncbi:MAG: diguanylate cyclase [Myxococcota bacterium]